MFYENTLNGYFPDFGILCGFWNGLALYIVLYPKVCVINRSKFSRLIKYRRDVNYKKMLGFQLVAVICKF
jgi:hypothetical protein